MSCAMGMCLACPCTHSLQFIFGLDVNLFDGDIMKNVPSLNMNKDSDRALGHV